MTSNRESGFGRYDVMLEPREPGKSAIIMEFKVQDAEDEKELSDTAKSVLKQIEEKNTQHCRQQRVFPKAISKNMALHSAVKKY